MNSPAKSPSMMDQAEFIEGIVSRCTMRDGTVASISDLSIDAGDVARLEGIAQRLWLMSAHEGQIRRLVTGR